MSKIDCFTKEELKEICENSDSYKEIAKKLGYSYGGQTLQRIKRLIIENNFVPHFKTKTREEQEYEKQQMIGKTFGRLTVLSKDEEKTKRTNRTYFICQCNCENKTIISVRYDGLTSKKQPTQSCGCLSKEFGHEQGIRNRENLMNQRFGKLIVLNYDEENSLKYNRAYWKVRCDCGTEYSVSAMALKRGQSSCGCESSIGELKVSEILAELNIEYKKQYTFQNLVSCKNRKLSYDFYVPQYNLLIECQGIQHYESIEYFGGKEQFEIQQEHDNLKRKYCKENNIKLIEIPYWDYNKIDKGYILNKIQN